MRCANFKYHCYILKLLNLLKDNFITNIYILTRFVYYLFVCLFFFTGDSLQYSVYPVERDCYHTMNTNYKAHR